MTGRKRPRCLRTHVIPIRSCSRRGLPSRPCRQVRGGLLPHLFTLTRASRAVRSLWHFPWGRPRRTLSGAVFPWSPDFPHLAAFRPLRSAAARPTGRGHLGNQQPKWKQNRQNKRSEEARLKIGAIGLVDDPAMQQELGAEAPDLVRALGGRAATARHNRNRGS